MIGIYKYQNKINGKIYIGRSTNIIKRKWEHLHQPSPYSYFDQILQKIGEDNFTFEIIEECSIEDLQEREKYWISYYHSYAPENRDIGYNLTRGGEEYKSEENPWSKLSIKQVEEIIDKLANAKISIQELAKVYKVHYNTISDINRCKTWNWLHDYKNNIRKESQGSLLKGELGTNKITEVQAKHIILLLETTDISQAQIARNYNYSEYIVNDINRCKTWTFLHSYQKNIRKESVLKRKEVVANEDN